MTHWIQTASGREFPLINPKSTAIYDVVGIPRGGLRFAAALRPYAVLHSDTVLIVDDVLTTGASMKEMRSLKESQGYHTIGLVIFARKQPPTWVEPIFRAPFGWRQ